MATTTYRVQGMTCDHCVRAITEEVGAVPGVTGVRVDLTDGSVAVASDRPVDRTRLAEAVAEAGYQLA
jgi:copper ion binding protein